MVEAIHIELSLDEIRWCYAIGAQRYHLLAERLRAGGHHKELERYSPASHGYECCAEYAAVRAIGGASPRFIVSENVIMRNVRVLPECGSLIVIKNDHPCAPLLFIEIASQRVFTVLGWMPAGAAQIPKNEGVYRDTKIWRADRQQLRDYTSYPQQMLRRQPGNQQ